MAMRLALYERRKFRCSLENDWAAYEIDYGMSDMTGSQIAWAPGRDRGMGRRTAHGL